MSKLPSILVAGLFLLAIWLPTLDILFKLDPSSDLREGRRAAAAPRMPSRLDTWAQWPRRFERYYDDRVGFRGLMVRGYHLVRTAGLRVSPSGHLALPPDLWSVFGAVKTPRVVLGEDRWLYFSGANNAILSDYRGVAPFTEDELRAWQTALEHRSRWLADHGIAYLFVVAPEKQSIYPEHMPDAVRRVSATTRLDQLLDHLAAHSDVPFVDLRPALRAAKNEGLVYEKTGTHWNGYGAFIAYREILTALQTRYPELDPTPLEAFEVSNLSRTGIDLARMIGLTHVYREEGDVRLTPRFESQSRRVTEGLHPLDVEFPEHARPFAMENPDARLRAVVFRDSFATALVPFLSEHFARSAFYWPRPRKQQIPLDPALIETEKPDIFIDEWVERSWMQTMPANHADLTRPGSP